MRFRTDLALEEQERIGDPKKLPKGVTCRSFRRAGIRTTEVLVRSREGAEALHKPLGRYITLEPESGTLAGAAVECAEALRAELAELLPPRGSALVIGLGNSAVTPDAVGPRTLEQLLVTRHLRGTMPALFGGLRQVSAAAPGVLGATGMESAEIVRGLVERVCPSFVVVIDALAAAAPARLCASIQLTDTGIVPGSGIRNDRRALNRQTLGVPVYAIGIPTVCDLRSLTETEEELIVTVGDIDARIAELARITGRGLNLALQPTLSARDLAEFVT